MVIKNMAYDHPAYLAVIPQSAGTLTGAAGLSTKFAAFTAMQVKSITLAALVLSTGADIVSVVKVTGVAGTNTTTTTQIYGTHGSGAYLSNLTPLLPASQLSLQQGDTWWVQKGADATTTFAATVELAVLPLANVTV